MKNCKVRTDGIPKAQGIGTTAASNKKKTIKHKGTIKPCNLQILCFGGFF